MNHNALSKERADDQGQLRAIAEAERNNDDERLSQLTMSRWNRKLRATNEWIIISPFDISLDDDENHAREEQFRHYLKSSQIPCYRIELRVTIAEVNRNVTLFVLRNFDRNLAETVATKWVKSIPILTGKETSVDVLDPVTMATRATGDMEHEFVMRELLASFPDASSAFLRFIPDRTLSEGFMLDIYRSLIRM